MICPILTVSSQAWLVHCACEEGFTSYRNPLTQVENLRQKLKILLSTSQVTSCTDVDECSEGRHTCHPSSTCRNTLGGSVGINFSPFINFSPSFCVFNLCLPGTRARVQPLEAHISAPQVAFSRERNISMGGNISQLETVWD